MFTLYNANNVELNKIFDLPRGFDTLTQCIFLESWRQGRICNFLMYVQVTTMKLHVCLKSYIFFVPKKKLIYFKNVNIDSFY